MTLYFIIYICFIIILSCIFISTKNDNNNTHRHHSTITEYENEIIGKIGEKEVLLTINGIYRCRKTLTNLYIPTVKGNTTEVDLITFTDNCIIVIEMKNYSGTIYENYDDDKWYAEVRFQNNFFVNPIKQNELHIKYIKKIISTKIPIYSIIVFSDRCTLECESSYDDLVICHLSNLKTEINKIIDKNKSNNLKSDIYTAFYQLENYANPDQEVIRKHKEYITNNITNSFYCCYHFRVIY